MKIKNLILLALALPLALMGCRKEEPVTIGETGEAVEFSVYTATMPVTRGASFDPDSIQKTGIGVFAFYQKAKSNGYPVDFNKYTGEPTFMYNQLVKPEVTSAAVYYTQEEIDAAQAIVNATGYVDGSDPDAETVASKTTSDIKTPAVYGDWDYTPHKYWSNNENDQFSFFAYAPYDPTFAWEDLLLFPNLKGDKIERHYVIEDKVEDQQDFLWANPIMNIQKPANVSSQLQFNFRHLCARLGVYAKVNLKAKSIYVTIDTVKIQGAFLSSGTLVYTPADDQTTWTDLGSDGVKTYYPFRATNELDEHGNLTYRTFEVDTEEQTVGNYMFVIPSTQDITLTAIVSQRSSTTSWMKSYTITKTFDAMALEGNKAYKFLLDITLTPVTFTGVVDATWSSSTTEYTSPDNGGSWH